MAITLVNAGAFGFINNTVNASPYTPTIAYTPSGAGNLLVLSGSIFSGTSAAAPVASNVTDDVDGAWPFRVSATSAPASNDDSTFMAAIICSSTAARTISAQFAARTASNWYYSMFVTEWSGILGFGLNPVVDVWSVTGATSGGNSLTLNPITTLNADDLILASISVFVTSGTGNLSSPTAPWTTAGNRQGGTGSMSHGLSYQTPSAKGTFNPTMTLDSAATGVASGVMASFMSSASGINTAWLV